METDRSQYRPTSLSVHSMQTGAGGQSKHTARAAVAHRLLQVRVHLIVDELPHRLHLQVLVHEHVERVDRERFPAISNGIPRSRPF